MMLSIKDSGQSGRDSFAAMNVIGFIVFVMFVIAIAYFVIESVESALMSLIVKDEDDYEALQFIIGCVSAKASGEPMPDKPSYIGADSTRNGKKTRSRKTH